MTKIETIICDKCKQQVDYSATLFASDNGHIRDFHLCHICISELKQWMGFQETTYHNGNRDPFVRSEEFYKEKD